MTRREIIVTSAGETEIRCDKCNLLIFEDLDYNDPESSAQELVIRLNQDQCVNFYRQRDYCPECLEEIWLGINALIGLGAARAWEERDREYDYER